MNACVDVFVVELHDSCLPSEIHSSIFDIDRRPMRIQRSGFQNELFAYEIIEKREEMQLH